MYFDLMGLVITLALYGAGAMVVLVWLARSESRTHKAYLLKWVVALIYFVVLPGYPIAENAHRQAQHQRAENQRREDRAETAAAYVRFCQENLKREKPLEACKRFRPLGNDEEQLVIK
ncbi:peptidylprolyl isomerase [Hydrogenophaga taeniospiralis]|uniref:hypothetical protein n=1 Tax=Hydrogenophaga taeniospiralis TaxID=65656 RepID=UPI0012FA8157|nr:hypothetical protein [Hydrogenophaga taeniospiralis]